jgi:hypothetical protein
MKTRPWPLVILAALHVAGPLINILFSAHLLGIGVSTYTTALWRQSSWLELLGFYLLIPAAGVAIYMVKEWSYPIFLGVMSWVLYSNYITWKEYPGTFSGPMMFVTFVVNFALVSYFLIPQVRAAYFNRLLRWWESAPRFTINVPGTLVAGRSKKKVQVTNLSEGGAFIASASRLERDSIFDLHFTFFGAKYDFSGKIVHGRDGKYGMQFIHTSQSALRIQRLVGAMSLLGVDCPSRVRNPDEELVGWAKRLLTTGKGWAPEIVRTAGVVKAEADKVAKEGPRLKIVKSHVKKQVRKAKVKLAKVSKAKARARKAA